jgi:adenylate cyclase
VSRPRFTLAGAFAAGFVVLVLALAALLAVTQGSTRRNILESAELLRFQAAEQITHRVLDYLGRAEGAIRDVEAEVRHGIVDPSIPEDLERALFSRMLANPELTELSAITARFKSYDDDGDIVLSEEGRAKMTVCRRDGKLLTRRVAVKGDAYYSFVRKRAADGALFSAPIVEECTATDPTLHPTFSTPAREDERDRLLWSDLHYADADEFPDKDRPVRVSVQKAIFRDDGKFAGVLRAGIDTSGIDKLATIKLTGAKDDPHRVFICDDQGRLITRLSPEDKLEEMGDDLRVSSSQAPPEVKLALARPELKEVNATTPRSGRFTLDGEDYLFTFRALGGTQDWIVGIVVPERFYLGGLLRSRDRLLVATLALMALIVGGGIALLRAIRRGQEQVLRETARMNRFEFAPAGFESPFADVRDALESLERAKTAMRAMGKYVPVDLVRLLYGANSEPTLEARQADVSLMFTDIRGFTTLSESLEPGRLAAALGRYLDVMVGVIHRDCSGTIDKFIGDAIMTMWNAPTELAEHPKLACRAALEAREACRALFASADWKGLPAFETRFGLHRERVMVGHFGSPDRMSYTAIGDGVNLASRLEGLNKQYGTWILASEAIVEGVGAAFEFRLVDRVAVKGKSRGVRVYELLAAAGGLSPEARERRERYERAFAAYQERRFAEALAGFEALAASDGASAAMAERARALQAEPPPADWDGVFEAHEK